MAENHYVVMLAEPDKATCSIYHNALCKSFEVTLASDEEAVLHGLRTQQINVLVLEPMLFATQRKRRLAEVSYLCAERGISFVICSTLDERRQGAELGVLTYLIKPVLPADLLHTLRRVLGMTSEARTSVENSYQHAVKDVGEDDRLVIAQAAAIMEERQRLARDLHDSVTQALYGIALHAEVARRLLASGNTANAASYLGVLQDTAQEALAEMRLLIFDLRPPILSEVGLATALQIRLEAVEGRANLQTHLTVDGTSKLPSLIEQALYGIARESLNNALKHARAQHIAVRLWQTQTSVCLEITDDGVGFDVSVARASGGIGLSGIAERVAQINGRFTLQSTPQAGTQLLVEIPI